MNGNDASQDLRQLTEKSKNRNGGRTRTARISSSEAKVLNPRFSIQRREPICHEYFQVGKKCRGAECIVVLELNNNKHFKKMRFRKALQLLYTSR